MSRKAIWRKLLLLTSDTGFPAVFADRAQPLRHGQRQKVVLTYKQRVNHKQCKFSISIYAMAKDTSVRKVAFGCVVMVGPDLLVLKKIKDGMQLQNLKQLNDCCKCYCCSQRGRSSITQSKLSSRAMGSQVYHCGDYETKMRQKCQQSRLLGASQIG